MGWFASFLSLFVDTPPPPLPRSESEKKLKELEETIQTQEKEIEELRDKVMKYGQALPTTKSKLTRILYDRSFEKLHELAHEVTVAKNYKEVLEEQLGLDID